MIDQLLAADHSLFLWINALPHPALLTTLMVSVSNAAIAGMCWTVGGAVVAIHRRDAGGLWRLTLAIVMTFVLVDIVIKPVVSRPRPYETHAVATTVSNSRPNTLSFPSGHAASAAAGAFALSRMLPMAWPMLWFLVLAIATSRIYLAVHYPLDVAVGLFVGLACAVFVTGTWFCSGDRHLRVG